jgi:integrase
MRRTRKIGASRSIRKVGSRRFSSAADSSAPTPSCSAARQEDFRRASRQPGSPSSWLPTPTKRNGPSQGARVDRAKLQQVDLHWHDLRHEGACRLLADRVDIRIIQLMLGHADIKQTQRYLNITDEELRKAMTGVWERRRQLRVVGG